MVNKVLIRGKGSQPKSCAQVTSEGAQRER
jgi:hypothetical protein